MGLQNGVVGWLPTGYEPGFFDVVAFVGSGGEVGRCCCCCCGSGGGFMFGLVVVLSWFEEGEAADDAAFERHDGLLVVLVGGSWDVPGMYILGRCCC